MNLVSPEFKIRFEGKSEFVIVTFFIVLTGIFIVVLFPHNKNTQNQIPIRKESLRNDIWCEQWEDGIIYCRWIHCVEGTADFFIKFIKETPRHKGTIVDLRGNAGGLLQEGIAFAGLWYDEDAPLLTLYRDENDSPVASIKNLYQKELNSPVVSIIDEKTISTAEVVAGLISALPNSRLVGRKTAGDPFARVEILAGDPPRSLEMKLTIQLHGSVVHHKGLHPDYTIKQSQDFQEQCIKQSILVLNALQEENQ